MTTGHISPFPPDGEYMRHLIKHFFLCILVFLLVGCATKAPVEKALVQAYASAQKQPSEVANVRCYVFEIINSIDNKSKYANPRPGDCNLEMLPGKHLFEIGYSHPTYKRSWLLDSKKVEFELKAGHTYMFWGSSPPVQTRPEGWELFILDMTDGSPDKGKEVPFTLK